VSIVVHVYDIAILLCNMYVCNAYCKLFCAVNTVEIVGQNCY